LLGHDAAIMDIWLNKSSSATPIHTIYRSSSSFPAPQNGRLLLIVILKQVGNNGHESSRIAIYQDKDEPRTAARSYKIYISSRGHIICNAPVHPEPPFLLLIVQRVGFVTRYYAAMCYAVATLSFFPESFSRFCNKIIKEGKKTYVV
jgi:hypothetical protein